MHLFIFFVFLDTNHFYTKSLMTKDHYLLFSWRNRNASHQQDFYLIFLQKKMFLELFV